MAAATEPPRFEGHDPLRSPKAQAPVASSHGEPAKSGRIRPIPTEANGYNAGGRYADDAR